MLPNFRPDIKTLSVIFTIVILTMVPNDKLLAKDKFVIGVDESNPPFSHTDLNGELTGFDIDIAKAICAQLKAECTLAPYKWSNLIAAIRGKKVNFAIAALNPTRERNELVDFTDPYIIIPSAIIVRKDSILSGVEPEDLRGAQLAALKSSPHGEYIRTHRPKTHIRNYEHDTEYFLDLINKQVDGIIGNPVLLNDWLSGKEGSDCCRLLGLLPHDPQINGIGYAIALEKDSEDLKKKLNRALKKLQKSSSRNKAISAHLPYLR